MLPRTANRSVGPYTAERTDCKSGEQVPTRSGLIQSDIPSSSLILILGKRASQRKCRLLACAPDAGGV